MADECGAEFGSSGNFVIDHMAYDQRYHRYLAFQLFLIIFWLLVILEDTIRSL